jgi:PAS domain S-box-containing protein
MDKNTKERQEKLRSRMVKEIADYAIILLDIDGTVLSWNKGAEKIKGYKEHEILGQNFSIFYLPLDREAGLPEQLIAEAKKKGFARYVGRRVRKDGSIFTGSIVLTAIHDENGEVIGFTKVTQEINGSDPELGCQ